MSFDPTVIIAAAGVATLAALARRDTRAAAARRRTILDPVAPLFADATVQMEACGYPKIAGSFDGDPVCVALIPDTITIRRLPQLWVTVTLARPLPLARRGLAALMRPSGADYYSLTEHLAEPLRTPPSWPSECLIRGEDAASSNTLASLTAAGAAVLSDPRIKEIAVTARGVRIVRQLAEGHRGAHLLLRQSTFESAVLGEADLRLLVANARVLAKAVDSTYRAFAA